MGLKIIVSPYSAKLTSGNRNPKDFPAWPEVVSLLKAKGYEVIQIGAEGEERIAGTDQHITNWPVEKLRELFNQAETYIAVDNFCQHF